MTQLYCPGIRRLAHDSSRALVKVRTILYGPSGARLPVGVWRVLDMAPLDWP